MRAPGNTCLSALWRHREAGDSIEDYVAFAPQLNNSKGCGGVMRAAPAGLAWAGGNQDAADREAAQIAAITHGHSLGYLPAAVLAHIIGRLVLGEVTLVSAVEEARDAVARLYADDAHIQELVGIIDLAIELAENGEADLANIHRLGEGWVGDEALAIAIYCALRHQENFSAGVIAAVNHRGDSDSTGAVCGNILGALLGYKAIDKRWTADLELLDVTLELADDLFAGCSVDVHGSCEDPAWECKYVWCHRYEPDSKDHSSKDHSPKAPVTSLLAVRGDITEDQGVDAADSNAGTMDAAEKKRIVAEWTMGLGVMGDPTNKGTANRSQRRALRANWKTLPMPLERTEIDLGLSVSTEEFERLTRGHIPQVMEDHWFMYFDGDALCFHRSWTGICIYKVHVAHDKAGDGYVLSSVTTNRDRSQYAQTNDESDRLLVCILVGQVLEKDVESLWEAYHASEASGSGVVQKDKPMAIGFWKEGEAFGCLSNWYPKGFELFGKKFATSEHWIMWQKARVMGDFSSADAILGANGPRHAKELGSKVSPYDEYVWRDVREQLAYVGIREKFLQNPELAQTLLATGDAVLAEASPLDSIWGVGIAADNPGFADMSGWRGENLLGRICMRVRTDLRLLMPDGPSRFAAATTEDDLVAVLASSVGDMSLLALARNPMTRPYALCYARVSGHAAKMQLTNVHKFLMHRGKESLANIGEAVQAGKQHYFSEVGWYELLAQLAFLRRVGML